MSLLRYTFLSSAYIYFSITLFLVGLFGTLISQRSLLIMLMSLEVMLLGLNLCFLTAATLLDDLMGVVFVLFILTVAAAETAIGLALIIAYQQARTGIRIDKIKFLRY